MLNEAAPRPGCSNTQLEIDSTQCYPYNMTVSGHSARAFKTAWFSKAARKARIGDDELCEAFKDLIRGQADDLGGSVFKKRLNKNLHRSIVLAKGARYWVYVFLFAKKDRANIGPRELEDFRTLATSYATMSDQQVDRLLRDGDLTEICHGDES